MSLNANGANAGELESSPTSGVVENKVLFFCYYVYHYHYHVMIMMMMIIIIIIITTL